MWFVYSGEVRGEVGTKSRMCGYMGSAIICYSSSIYLDLLYHLMFVESLSAFMFFDVMKKKN